MLWWGSLDRLVSSGLWDISQNIYCELSSNKVLFFLVFGDVLSASDLSCKISVLTLVIIQ